MREVLDELDRLIQFQGLDFRSTSITCKHCGWSGTGGALQVPELAASGEPVVYACPACMEAVAVHNGLSDQEVMDEMEKIHQILAAEMAVPGRPAENTTGGPPAEPDFAAIRAQLPTQVEVAADTEAAEAGEPAGDSRPEDDNPNPEPDFESVRARLGALA